MNNVDYPIYLTQVRCLENIRAYFTDTCSQCYENTADFCDEYPSKLSISDVHCTYPHLPLCPSHSLFSLLDINVTGMSSGKEGDVVVELECSAECSGFTATCTDLTSPDYQAVYYCQNIADETALDFTCTAPPS